MKYLNYKLVLCFCSLAGGVLVSAQSPEELSTLALAELTQRDAMPFIPHSAQVEEHMGEDAFVYVVEAPEESVNTYTLLSKNGNPVSEKEAAEFAEERNIPAPGEDGAASTTVDRLMDLIDDGKLTFLEQNGDDVLFAFSHVMPFSDDVSVALTGRLHYDVSRGYVTSLELFNEKFFKADSAKIKDFKLTFSFAKVDALDRILTTQATTHVEGSAMLFFSFEESCTMTFSDYRKL
ncbi:MAG: hypothetical protein JW739_01410 [Opitutales bacterium]|nr:hypothetical protein [Opitutales bacterium]